MVSFDDPLSLVLKNTKKITGDWETTKNSAKFAEFQDTGENH